MTTIAIQCANCGAKYKLPETFTGEKAKCKACGSTMDVKAARMAAPAAPAPAPAAPAAARPVERPSAPRPVPRAEAKPEAEATAAPRPLSRSSSRAERGEAKADAAEAGERPARAGRAGREHGGSSRGGRSGSRSGSRHGKEGGEKKKGPGLMIAGIGGGVVVLGLVLWLAFGGKKDEPHKTDQATNTPSAGSPGAGDSAAKPGDAAHKPADKPSDAPKQEETKKDATKQEPKADKPKADKPKADPEKGAEKPVEKTPATQDKAKTEPDPKDASAKGPEKEKSNYGNKNIKTKEDAFVPSKELKPLEHEEGTTDERKKELDELVETVVSGGGPARNKAKVKIKDAGRPAMIAVINRLRELDYFDDSQSRIAFDLNKLLEEMTGGMNALFKLPEGDIDPQRADYNGHTVEVWQKLMEKYPTAEKFAEWANAHKASKKARDDGDGK